MFRFSNRLTHRFLIYHSRFSLSLSLSPKFPALPLSITASGSGVEEWKKRSHESDKDQRVPPERTPEKESVFLEKEPEKEQISAGKSSEKERVPLESIPEKEIVLQEKNELIIEKISPGKLSEKELIPLERTLEKEIVLQEKKEPEKEQISRAKPSDKNQRVPPERTPEKEIIFLEKEPEKEQISAGKSSDKDQRVPPERTPEKESVFLEKEPEKEQISPGKSSEKELVSPEEGLDKKPTASDSASTLEAKKLNLLPEVKYLTKELDLEHVDLHNLPHMVDPEQYYSYPQVTETSERPLDSPAEVSVVVEKTAQSTENVSIGSGKSVLMTLLKESHSVGGLKKTNEPEKPDLVFNKEKAVCTFKLPPPNIETKNMGNLDQNTSPVGTLAAMDPSTEPLNYNQEHGRNITDSPRPLKGPRTTTEDEHFHTAPPPNSQESAPETGLSTSAAITDDNEKDAAWYQFAIFEAMTRLRDQSEGCNDNDIAKRILEKYKVVPVNFKMEVMRHHVGELYMKGILTEALKGFRRKGVPFETWSKQYDALKKKMEKAKKV